MAFRIAAVAALLILIPLASTVSLGAATAAAPTAAPAEERSARISMRMLRLEPGKGGTVDRKRPEISATFSETIDPKTIRLTVDGRDVTLETDVSDRSFVYNPNFDLALGSHAIAVSGETPDREAFDEHWTFTSSESAGSNYISGLEPPNGTALTSAFIVSAFTRPKARVRIVVATSDTIANFSDVTGGSSTTDALADPHGYFEVRISLPDRASGVVDLRIVSATADGSLAIRTLRLRQ